MNTYIFTLTSEVPVENSVGKFDSFCRYPFDVSTYISS
jgi:hypothetical protein